MSHDTPPPVTFFDRLPLIVSAALVAMIRATDVRVTTMAKKSRKKKARKKNAANHGKRPNS